jgi:hypothetical protein
MPEGASKHDAFERIAHNALQLLQHDHDLIVTSLKLWKFELGALFWCISLLRSETFMGWYIPSV